MVGFSYYLSSVSDRLTAARRLSGLGVVMEGNKGSLFHSEVIAQNLLVNSLWQWELTYTSTGVLWEVQELLWDQNLRDPFHFEKAQEYMHHVIPSPTLIPFSNLLLSFVMLHGWVNYTLVVTGLRRGMRGQKSVWRPKHISILCIKDQIDWQLQQCYKTVCLLNNVLVTSSCVVLSMK